MTEKEQIAWDLAKAFRKWERDDTGKNLMHWVEKAGLTVKRSPQDITNAD